MTLDLDAIKARAAMAIAERDKARDEDGLVKATLEWFNFLLDTTLELAAEVARLREVIECHENELSIWINRSYRND